MILRLATSLLVLAACLPTACGDVVAQEPGAAAPNEAAASKDALTERIDKAIADYEAAAADKNAEAQRRKQLTWLGEIDHERVTRYLRDQLKAEAKSPFGTAVLAAIGKVPRPDLERDVLAVMKSDQTNQAVRIAAARWLFQLGDAGTDRVLELANDKAAKPPVRAAMIEALAASDSSRAQRGLAALMLDGDNDHRLRMLQMTNGVRDVAAISNARVTCVKEGNLIVAAMAWRQLASERHVRARSLTIDVVERVFDTPDAAAAAELVQGLAIVRDKDFYPAILRFGAVRGPGVKAALRAAATDAAEDPALLAWLVEEGLDAETPAERDAAKLLLLKAPVEAVQPLVARVRKQLKLNRRKVVETAAGLHELLAKDPTWQQDLATMAAARDLESRMIGLSMLLEMGSTAGLASAQKNVDSKSWELRSLTYRYLTKCRDVTSIPELIGRYGKEEGRLAYELDKALFVHTGTRCWSRPDWQKWWRTNQKGFVLPHPETVKGSIGTGGGTTVSYYDIPLVSSRIAFIVDRSGSMRANVEAVGTDRQRTRLEAAKQQLQQVIGALPKDHKCNLILFETAVFSVWKELRVLDDGNRKELLEAVQKIPYGGGTNTFGGLITAFEDPDVDTIYLLTDGQPTAGEVIDPLDIVDEIMRVNRTRQVTIHCISVGLDSQLLKDLAELTGGEYKYVK